MFKDAIREKLIKHFRVPVRPHGLVAHAESVMHLTRFRNVHSFINRLQDVEILKMHTIKAKNGRKVTLWSSGELTALTLYELAVAVYPDGYFCNLSSIYYHSLTNQVPSAVYFCHEAISASRTKSTGVIGATRIRNAFIKPHRYTKQIYDLKGRELIVVDRQRGSDFGVVSARGGNHLLPSKSKVTGVERALIDAVVAPHYNGGATSLCSYFEAARQKLDIQKLVEIYRKSNFAYPYAQAIGFFLAKAGMRKQAEVMRKAFPPEVKFYVDHGAKTSWTYDEHWMLYYPKGIVDED